MRILMLSDWLPPDFGAIGQYASRLAGDLASSGHQVTLGGLNSARASQLRECRGTGSLTVRRVARPTYDKASFGGRAWWTLKTNLSLLWHSRSELRWVDEIRFTGDRRPPT